MGDKSERKRSYILETARRVFMEKGFQSVTMKDIVEACEISRGGLYVYFSSTKEIFLEVWKLEQLGEEDLFTEGISEDATIADILAFFLKEQKREILRKKNDLTVAVYEFLFQNKVSKKDNFSKRQFDAGVLILENLIQDGIETGEFYCEHPRGAASNIMYILEGLKITSRTIGITEAAIDRELFYIMKGLVNE